MAKKAENTEKKETATTVKKYLTDQIKQLKESGHGFGIRYPQMFAQIVPHFDGVEIPAFGKDNLWFL